MLLRKIEATSSLISEKVPLPDRVDDKGHFIILRDNDIFEYRLAGAFQKEDIVVAFTKECDFEVVAKWFQQNLAY